MLDIRDTPKGIRTPVASVKGRCPRPLDDGGEASITLARKNRMGRVSAALSMDGSYGSAVPFVKEGSTRAQAWPFHTGTVKWKQAPSPGSDTTQMRPP